MKNSCHPTPLLFEWCVMESSLPPCNNEAPRRYSNSAIPFPEGTIGIGARQVHKSPRDIVLLILIVLAQQLESHGNSPTKNNRA